jgi:tripartite ATP-independent transporter DctP family solute receptor
MRLITLLPALLGIAAAVPVSTAKARNFQASDVLPSDSPTVQAMKYMGELLREHTGGRLRVNVHHGDQASEDFTIGRVRTVRIDMARVNLAALNSILPTAIVPSLPYLFRSAEHMRHVLDGPIGDGILADLKEQGLIGLCFYDQGARSFYSSKGPIRTPKDFQGLNVSLPSSETWAELVRIMGARPVSLPFDQIGAALKTGVIDASENNWPTYVATGHHNFAKYFSRTEHSMMPGVVIFSAQIWNELSAADRRTLRAAAKNSVPFMRSKLYDYEVSARLKAENSGSIVIDDVDRDAFARLLLPLYPKLLRNARVQQMIRDVEAVTESASVP